MGGLYGCFRGYFVGFEYEVDLWKVDQREKNWIFVRVVSYFDLFGIEVFLGCWNFWVKIESFGNLSRGGFLVFGDII